MDPRAESLIRRFADIESGEEVVTTVHGRRTTSVRQQHAEVTALRPEQGLMEVMHDRHVARLHLDEAELLELLRTAGRDGSEVWGEPLSDEEAAARFLSIWLDESLATREPHPSGWWTYRDAGFDPLPPWEALAGRRQRS